MVVEFKDNSKQVLAEFERAKKTALTMIGKHQNGVWSEEIRNKGVVDTGRFMGSPGMEVDAGNDQVIVGSTVTDPPYPVYLELGTSKMAARPTLKPSIIEHRDEYKAIVEKVMKG